MLSVIVLFGLLSVSSVYAQVVSDAPFLEHEGLVVMETESVPRPQLWKFLTTEPGYTGAGYLRYTGPDQLFNPGVDIIEYNFVIENPGMYGMVMQMSHLGAPAGDMQNDVWTRMDANGTWIKALHPFSQMNNGFTMHTQWALKENGVEVFRNAEYFLTAGVHTFFMAARSFNVRVDRIHFWKLEAPFKVSFATSRDASLPESLRDANILAVTPNPIVVPAVAAGQSGAPFEVTLANAGDETISISSIALSGASAADFSLSATSGVTVPAGGSTSINVTFSPDLQGTKTASLTFTHDGLNSPLVVPVSGNSTSGGTGTTILFRVNAGGPEIPDGAYPWLEDQSAIEGHDNGASSVGTPHPYVNAVANGDWTFGRDETITLDASVPAGTPVALFQRGRWDPSSSPSMQWNIPIEAGKEIEVRLYFAEQLFNAPDDPQGVNGPRVFDVAIEGVVPAELDNFQIASTGVDLGIMRSFVIVSDGNVDIDFSNITHDPIIQGIEILEISGLSRSMNEGWNLVGVPVTPANTNYASVFGNVDVTTQPFLWNGLNYAQSATVGAGAGYWLNLGAAGTQDFEGAAVNSVEFTMDAGWQLISGPGCIVPFSAVDDPSGILVEGTLFAYGSAYEPAATLLPGFGYWVLADGEGTVTITCGASGKTAGAGQVPDVTTFGIITVQDMLGASQELFFGDSLETAEDINFFAMPPVAPGGSFDVRFTSDHRLAEGAEAVIQLQSTNFPMELTLTQLPADFLGSLIVEEQVAGQVTASHVLTADGTLSITDANVNKLRIVLRATATADESFETLPGQFALRGNYPNPFNPTTTLLFDMPASGTVTVQVFDMLGRQVLDIPAAAFGPGAAQQVQIDAHDMASGLYIYQIKADMAQSTVVQTGRMTLLK
ncbi:MAG: choice-of-anchor D domain-containing protein [Rhodothermales bacterium]|nr:choice-of-anchor D domain-containing protein [Rhodothermales bacterium]